MRILAITLFIALSAAAFPAFCQDETGKNSDKKNDSTSELTTGLTSAGTVPATADMWFYEQQLREYLNPKLAVRRKAEFQTTQRQQRLASMRWFGFSNLRPVASPDPVYGDYSPSWTGADVLHPYRWSGCGYSGWAWYEAR